eukprot:gnl/TRDRNA2_/TRDRNA2_134099_c0_seq1.p1 gnl/TRDRNA2_/TRDRNA2_134099_c0~~gnl/TRDRNA2_/TRDRNA2_134099_c0_seq1.p1  ORF type:complete len:276 (-),score=72.55 gnl/TRDRNA2_/TRDRNA2_134099_c0_seq1:63-890(-)
MGGGASAGVASATQAATPKELEEVFSKMSPEDRARISKALGSSDTNGSVTPAATTPAAPAPVAPAPAAPAPAAAAPVPYTGPPAEPAQINKIHSAVRWGKSWEEVGKVITDVGCNLEQALAAEDPQNGNRMLHISAQNGHYELTQQIVVKKADLSAQNGKGQTPLHMSIEYDFYFQSKYLLDKGANPKATNGDGVEAILGIDGKKTGTDAWDNPVTILKAASDDATELDIAFKALEAADASVIDKGALAGAGMKKKKLCTKHWDKDRFMAIMGKL